MYLVEFNGKEYVISTDVSLFSPKGADRGTLCMLDRAKFGPDQKLLDLGCGTGIVSVAACAFGVDPRNVVMADIDPRAVKCAASNMEANGFYGAVSVVSDGFSDIPGKDYDLILSNPPYHTDFKVAKNFIEKGFNRLKIGGVMMMVTKRKDWYKNKLLSVFGGVRISEEEGYFVFEAQKRDSRYASKR